MRKSSTTLKTNESKKSLTRQHGVLAPKTHARPLLLSSHHLALNRHGRRGTTDDFTTSFLHFPLFSTALWDLPNSGPVHCLMSSHLFLCLPCLLPPFTVPYKMVLASPDEQETCPYHFSFCVFTMVRWFSCGSVCFSLR